MRSILIITAALFVTGCMGSGRSPERQTSGDLTAAALMATDAPDMYMAIQSLRPIWLGSRGPTSASDPTPTHANVAVNGAIAGDIGHLRNLRIQDVQSARLLSPGQASARYGMGHPRGVIEIILRRQ